MDKYAKQSAQRQQEMKDYIDSGADPSRFFSNQNIFQKIAWLLMAGAAGYHAHNAGQENLVLKKLESLIKADVDNQLRSRKDSIEQLKRQEARAERRMALDIEVSQMELDAYAYTIDGVKSLIGAVMGIIGVDQKDRELDLREMAIRHQMSKVMAKGANKVANSKLQWDKFKFSKKKWEADRSFTGSLPELNNDGDPTKTKEYNLKFHNRGAASDFRKTYGHFGAAITW